MLLSFNWFKDIVSVKESAQSVAETLTVLGFEVETIEKFGRQWKDVVVAVIEKIEPHPRADRLHLATVYDGSKKYRVVCGAPNITVGQKVPLAKIGVLLPNGQQIAKAVIRGEHSEGMLCSPKELDFGVDHSGIMILPPSVRPGASLQSVIGGGDLIFDITVPANRPDCASVIGLAREFSAAKNRSTKIPSYKLKTGAYSKTSPPVNVIIEDKKFCPKYSATYISGVTVGQSPLWLMSRLVASGIRPINNVVDVSNYIMLESGRPTHAFDADTIKRGVRKNIRVRQARKGEILETLDGQKRQLDTEMTVIADDEGPIALAGIMGGARTEVTVSTKNVILEAAVFNPVSVRKTSRKIGLHSESSGRFEKGLDSLMTEKHAMSAAELIAKLTNSKVYSSQKVIALAGYQKTSATVLDAEWCQNLLGLRLSPTQIKGYLSRLGFKVSGSKKMRVTAPSWRRDIAHSADLAEEVGRLYGLNNLPATILSGELRPVGFPREIEVAERSRDLMVAYGFTEVVNYSFYSDADKSSVPAAGHYRVINSLRKDQSWLRTSLLPRLRESVARNAWLGDRIAAFEVGYCFFGQTGLPVEKLMLGLGLVRKGETTESIFREIKGLIQGIGRSFGIQETARSQKRGSSYQLFLGQTTLGKIELVDPTQARQMRVEGAAGFAEVELGVIISHMKEIQYKAFVVFPSAERDVAVIVREEVSYDQIVGCIRSALGGRNQKLLAEVTQFGNIFRGSKIEKGRKSLPIRLVFQADDRTLRSEEIDVLLEKVHGKLISDLGARLG
ncbi:MAG: phenylalanine--tRNA ligase subunit beta [bacterium]|nr:phenylalanine--tRNA ligase subunit beta [bacterium]